MVVYAGELPGPSDARKASREERDGEHDQRRDAPHARAPAHDSIRCQGTDHGGSIFLYLLAFPSARWLTVAHVLLTQGRWWARLPLPSQRAPDWGSRRCDPQDISAKSSRILTGLGRRHPRVRPDGGTPAYFSRAASCSKTDAAGFWPPFT